MDIEQSIVRLCELLCMSEGLHFAVAEDKVARGGKFGVVGQEVGR